MHQKKQMPGLLFSSRSRYSAGTDRISHTCLPTRKTQSLPAPFSGSHPTQSDALIAKNYCTEDELLALNDIVSAYLDLAEMQARRRIPMYMSDWIDTLDAFSSSLNMRY